MASKIKLRRGTKQQWIDAYPIILDIGEPGLELDTDKVKYGDGLSEWQNLTYSSEPIPAQLGNGGKFLTTDGAGVLSWASLVDDDSLYVTTTSLTSTLSNYALTTSVSGFINSTALGNYTFTDDAGDTIRNSSIANINLKTGTRAWSFQPDGTTHFPNYTFPEAHGSAGQVLKDNGAGVLYWAADVGSGTVTSISGTGTVSGITLSGTVTTSGNLTLGGTLAVPVSNITATGSASSATYLRGDGSWAAVVSSGNANTGSFTFSSNQLSVNNTNNITLVTNGKTWTFGANGTTTLPTGGSISAGAGNSTVVADSNGIVLAVDTTHYVGVGLPSTVINSNGNIWTFDSNGTTTLPTGGSISAGAGNSTVVADSDGIVLAVDTTHYVAVGLPSTVINSNGKTWIFDSSGTTTLPTGGSISAGAGNSTVVADGDGIVLAVDTTHYIAVGLPSTLINSNGKTWTFDSSGVLTLPTSGTISRATLGITALSDSDGVAIAADATNYIISSSINAIISSNNKNWKFDNSGILTLPAGGTIKNSDGSTYGGGMGGLSVSDFGEGFSLTSANKIVTNKLYSTNVSNSSVHYRLELTTGGTIKLPDQSEIIGSTLKGIYGTGDLNYTGLTIGPSSGNSENTWMYVDAYNAYIATDYADKAYTWKFDNTGVLNFPNNNGQIGQLELPYTGLEFRTGSNADWIGISYGEINDNNTSYFYFDKDGSDYLTANHQAHLQIKNPEHNGHLEWLFDSAGTLTLPQSATIADTGNSVVIKPNHLASDFQLEIKAYDDVVTPDDIHIRATDPDHGLTLGDSNGGSYVSINGDLHDNEIIVSTINKNNEERKEFVFDVEGHLHVPGDVQVSSIGAFRNSSGVRAAYVNEIPTDVSDLTDNSGIISAGQQLAEISIDGGHALAFFAPPIAADGGGSAGRFGPNSIVFNGGGASGGIYDTVLNGGGA